LATSIKNIGFIDSFFRRMRRVRLEESEILAPYNAEIDYPYVSPCGIELNFVRPADAVIVFHTLKKMKLNENDSQKSCFKLEFGGTLTQLFMPEKLAVSKRTGRLYHELFMDQVGERKNKKYYATELQKSNQHKEFGLIKSSLAVALSDSFVHDDRDEATEYSGLNFIASDTDEKYPIRWLPGDCEPGSWSLPLDED